MNYATQSLTGLALDYAFGKAEDYEVGVEDSQPSGNPWLSVPVGGGVPWTPRYGQIVDNVIDRELIATWPTYNFANNVTGWRAGWGFSDGQFVMGDTRREAAMRAWVARKLGMEVNVPESLKGLS